MFEKSSFREKPKSLDKREKILELTKMFRGFDCSGGVENGSGKFRGSVDFTNKKVEAYITPEGMRVVCDSLKQSEFVRGVLSVAEDRMREYLRKKK